jgi:hypothetical protein
MYEFDAVSVSSFEAASLAAKLSEKSAEGWDVVAIVPAGSDVTAFLKRASTGASAEATTDAAADTAPTTTGAVAEPAGWGSAPAAADSSWDKTSTGAAGAASATSDSGQSGSWGSAQTGETQTTPTTPATPSVPAGWYHDPAGRYELRYWDGSAWTEHVSRAGQQYTDPPVA